MSPVTRPVPPKRDYVRDSDPKKGRRFEAPKVHDSTLAALKQLLGPDGVRRIMRGRR